MFSRFFFILFYILFFFFVVFVNIFFFFLLRCVAAVDALKDIAKQNVELSVKERDLLSAAYKNLIGPKRSAWRVVSAAAQKEL